MGIGPEGAITDVRNGAIPQLSRVDVRSLGGFENPLGEGGADQRGHNGVVLLTLQLIPCVIERLGDYLGLIGPEAGF